MQGTSMCIVFWKSALALPTIVVVVVGMFALEKFNLFANKM
jgi:hypothetical protein